MKLLLTVFFILVGYNSFSQIQDLKRERQFLVIGIGPTLVGKYIKPGGYNAKIGGFLKNDLLLLGYFEASYLFQDEYDYGIGLRKYYGKSDRFKVFLQPNISYSKFQPWLRFGIPSLQIEENPVRRTSKISGVGGAEIRFGRRRHFNVNFELGYGYYTNYQFGRIITRASLNYVITKKANR